MNHVAEIQNPADRLPAPASTSKLCRVAIAMDGLAAQRAQRRAGVPRNAADTLVDARAAPPIRCSGAILGELGQPPHVPGQAPRQRRMEKTLQRAIEPRQSVAEILQQPARRRRLGQQPARAGNSMQTGRVDAVAALDAARAPPRAAWE